MRIDDPKVLDVLVKSNYVAQEDATRALTYAQRHHTAAVDYLLAEKIVTKDLLGQAISEHLGVVYTDLNTNTPKKDDVLLLDEAIAQEWRIVVARVEKRTVVLASEDPKRDGITEALTEALPKKKLVFTYSLPEDIDAAFVHYRKPLDTRFSKIMESSQRVAPEILDEIFQDAQTFRASDIHFEPRREDVVVRFRVDSVLHEAGRIPKQYYENILNRVKVQSNLRIDEHAAAQDGSMRYEGKRGSGFDLRTSIVPTIEGEKIVLRVLAAHAQQLSLTELGLSAEHQKKLEDAAHNPFGMILVTGPTGSGKTTTLYALLKMLNHPEVNITTIEDPVEYKIQGVNHIQVNNATNLTFASGLRSIVRQDPDVILVGEIRDTETAEIAVNAALTGHLLLSTFHANDAPTAIPRLLDMGVEPFLLASMLEALFAQRLVRAICDNCRISTNQKATDIKAEHPHLAPYLKGKKNMTLYMGKGCDICSGTGYRGRTAIFEFVSVTPEMKELILTNPSTQELWKLARKQGANTLFEDGFDKVLRGITTLDELMRVAPPSKVAS